MYFLVYEFAFFLILNYLYVLYVKRNISFYTNSFDKEVTVGADLSYEIIIINNSILPVINIAILEGDSDNNNILLEETYLLPLKNKKVKKEFKSKKRGIYNIGPFISEISDPFGIFKLSQNIDIHFKFVVMPKVFDVYIDLPSRQYLGDVEIKNKAYEDYTNILRLRKYIDGDSLKRIHWKVSAKKQQLFVKEYEVSASKEVYLLWNLYEKHYVSDYTDELDEKCAECMVSVSKFCLQNNIPVNLLEYESGKVQLSGKTIKDFNYFKISTLKNFPVYSKDLVSFLKSCKSIPYNIILIVITPYLDNQTLNELYELKSNRDIIVFYVNLQEGIKDKLNKFDIKLIPWGR
ncbi:MAG: DUF58 domain-containing protein [Thermoanaerobacteraceae bacterium]